MELDKQVDLQALPQRFCFTRYTEKGENLNTIRLAEHKWVKSRRVYPLPLQIRFTKEFHMLRGNSSYATLGD